MNSNEEICRQSEGESRIPEALYASIAQQRLISSFLESVELESQQGDYTSDTLLDLNDDSLVLDLNVSPYAYTAVYNGLYQALQAFQEHFYSEGSRLQHYRAVGEIPEGLSWLTAMSMSLQTIVGNCCDPRRLSHEALGQIWRSSDFVASASKFFDFTDLQAQLIFFGDNASLTWQSMSMRMLVLLDVLQGSLKGFVFALGIVSREFNGEYRVSVFKPLDDTAGPHNTTLWVYVDNIVDLDHPTSEEVSDSYNTWTGFCAGAALGTEPFLPTSLMQALTAPHPPATVICKVLQAPPPWTRLPFGEMQGITGEELLTFFPNHALTWPAICERLAWDFPNVADITRLVNRSAWEQINQHGVTGEVITDAEVASMIATGRREYRGFTSKYLNPFDKASPAQYLAAKKYAPPHNWGLTLEELEPAYSLDQLGRIAKANPNFEEVEASGAFSQRVLQVTEGHETAQEERNPPSLPTGWRKAKVPDESA